MGQTKLLIIGIAIGVLSGCATVTQTNTFSEKISTPITTKTHLTDHLSCFGDMLAEYSRARNNGKLLPIRAAIMSAKDATNISTDNFPDSEIPSDFKDMALGVASNIGGPLRILHVPSSEEIVDAIRLNTTNDNADENITPFTARHYNAKSIQIYAAITEYDRFLSNSQINPEASLELGNGSTETNIEASMTNERNVARMTMDFRIAQPIIGDIINHASSTNTVTLYQIGRDRSFGISVDGQTIGLATLESIVDARHKAIRLLVELGLIETFGKYAKVPYWKCLPSKNKQQDVVFDDVLKQHSGQYDFSQFTVSESDEELVDKKSAGKYDTFERVDPPQKGTDIRDHNLIMAMKSEFEYAQYVKVDTRAFEERPNQDFSFGTKKASPKLNGRKKLLVELLSIYKKQDDYQQLHGDALLNKVKSTLIQQNVLSSESANSDTNTFLALWLNAPIQRGGRWKLN